ncbi:MAG TPA: AmmeMemoRadiSam system protein B [Candidatus Hydrogenedentes bacterium]|nr:AmmeMemoRadiSam system protein B [Candidatus Hydrogenedentota bacterium]
MIERHVMRLGWFGAVFGYVCLAAGLSQGAPAKAIIRPPVAAGTFYPDKAETLQKTLDKYFETAVVPRPSARLVACIAPHSAYGFCGEVAAHAFKSLQPGQFDRVILIAPSHFREFQGCSMPIADGFATPLGVVPIDRPLVEKLSRSPLIDCKDLAYWKPEGIHEREYDVENLLPFLQARLGVFKLVPVVVGKFTDLSGNFDRRSCKAVAEAIRAVVDDRTLLVVSTDLTHYGNEFGFKPSPLNMKEAIEELDQQAVDLIINHDSAGFQNYLETTKNPICGANAVQILLMMLPSSARGIMLAHDLSANKTKETNRSVSYVSIGFYIPEASLDIPDSGSQKASSQEPKRGSVVMKLKGNAREVAFDAPPQPEEVRAAFSEETEEPPPQEMATPTPESDAPVPSAPETVYPSIPKPEPVAEPAKEPVPVETPSTMVDTPMEPEPLPVPAPETVLQPQRVQNPGNSGKKGTVTIKMKGTKGQNGPVTLEVDGTPVGTGEHGSVTYQGPSGHTETEESSPNE